jgi:hypothetical protein
LPTGGPTLADETCGILAGVVGAEVGSVLVLRARE